MKLRKNKAFTLVELIVTITILTILATIAFVSLQGYNKNARDSVRITDIKYMSKALELFILKSGFYPKPTDGVQITFSGSEVRTQGVFGDSVATNIRTISKKPVDPLTETEYTYSRLNTKKEFELGTLLEGEYLAYQSILSQDVYAASKEAVSYIKGSYNGITATVHTGSTTYVLAVPSIITTDLQYSDILSIITNKAMSYNGFKNISSSYTGLGYTSTGGFNYNPANLIVYEGNISDLSSSGALLVDFVNKLQSAYSGSDLTGIGQYNTILFTDTNSASEIITLSSDIINNNLGGNVIPSTIEISGSCETQTYSNTADYANSPAQLNVAWQNSNNGSPCYYQCINGYSGNDCSIAPPPATCATNPAFANLGQLTVGTPSVNNQGWVFSTMPGNCTYTCTNGFTGTNCTGNVASSSFQTDTGCNNFDITFGSYTLAGCDLGTDDNNNLPYYYQWGRTKGFTNNDTIETSTKIASYDVNNDNDPFVIGSTPAEEDWLVNEELNLWGDITNTYLARQGPCPTGYHIPAINEWLGITREGGWTTPPGMREALLLNRTGWRSSTTGDYTSLTTHSLYQSTTPVKSTMDDSYMYLLSDSSNDIRTYDINRNTGISLRCFKNTYTGLSCTNTPYASANIRYVNGNPETPGTAWQKTDELAACHYECTNLYSGVDCATPPSAYQLATSCMVPDINLGSYTIAGCNLGAEKGLFYDTVCSSNEYPNNLTNTCDGTLANQGTLSCPAGYHIPSSTEWTNIVAAGGWGNKNDMMSALKIPASGYYNISTYGNSYSGLWASDAGYKAIIFAGNGSILPSSTATSDIKLPTRCIVD